MTTLTVGGLPLTDYELLADALEAAGLRGSLARAYHLATLAWQGQELPPAEAAVVAAWEARTTSPLEQCMKRSGLV